MIGFLSHRSIGQRQRLDYNDLTPSTKLSLNNSMNRVCMNLDELRQAMHILTTTSLAIIKENAWSEIERAVFHVSEQLLENHQVNSTEYKPVHIKRQEREVFIAIGGIYQLLKLLDHPFSASTSSIFLTNILRKHSDIWNVALVTLRELTSSVPYIGDVMFSNSHIIFLFTLLSHTAVFENALNLIEEVLASKAEIFSLRSVPNLHAILKSFTTRQLAHFCRALALLLFEPEDRQILEGAQSLRSLDLIQLRRDKLSRPSYTVERNQSLMVESPILLPRLLSLLRIINYAPNLKELIEHQIMIQASLFTYEILYHMLAIDESESDWDYFNQLVDNVDAATERLPGQPAKDSEDERVQRVLLDAFTPNMTENNVPSMDMNNILSVIQAAHQLGVASESTALNLLLPSRRLNTRRYSRARRTDKTLRETKNELLFHSMILVPHQIEVIFVLCTLLSGRRKLHVQNSLLQLGLPSVLTAMFHRMSWETPPFSGPNPFEHAHGPSCECNPESALRVQYLRLVHNFFDRDFVAATIKQAMLSPYERQSLINSASLTSISEIHIEEPYRGLLTLLMGVLFKEPSESMYRFWLSSCVEAYLRGSRCEEQRYVIQCGLMKYLVSNILNAPANLKLNMQTAFDLLGELIKQNKASLRALEEMFTESTWKKFCSIVLRNLVDSNVFVRSLYLSIGLFEMTELHGFNKPKEGYLSTSWVQAVPVHLDHYYSHRLMAARISAGAEMAMEWNASSIDVTGFERIYSHIMSSKQDILVALVSAITLYTINHENICCVNSALVILLLEYLQGSLETCMAEFKYHCDVKVPSAKDNLILINFRELLWYWSEYYSRRGRDRLSLEFSSTRISAATWEKLVNMLCADDASPCALLTAPIVMPTSPYQQRGRSAMNREF